MFAALGYGPLAGQGLSVRYVALLSLTDTILLLALIAMCLSARGERARDVFLGARPPWREALAGLPLTFVALLLGVMVLAGIQRLAPWLHTVEHNPLQELIRTPRDAAVFAVVVVVAGGLREEIQRAFLLRRFEQWLGGAGVGVVVTSVAFGAGHLVQGADAAIATGLARRLLVGHLPAPSIRRGADRQPRRLQPAAARTVSRGREVASTLNVQVSSLKENVM